MATRSDRAAPPHRAALVGDHEQAIVRLTWACPFSLIRDPDTKFGRPFDAVLADSGIQIVKSGVQIPRMNSIMERWIQTCRRELLDRTLIWNQRHLLHVLHEFESFYNGHRPHRALTHAAPLRRLPEPFTEPAQIRHLDTHRRDRLNGILHEYQHGAWPSQTTNRHPQRRYLRCARVCVGLDVGHVIRAAREHGDTLRRLPNLPRPERAPVRCRRDPSSQPTAGRGPRPEPRPHRAGRAHRRLHPAAKSCSPSPVDSASPDPWKRQPRPSRRHPKAIGR